MRSLVAEANSSLNPCFLLGYKFDAGHATRDSKARLPHLLSTVCLLYHQGEPERKGMLMLLVLFAPIWDPFPRRCPFVTDFQSAIQLPSVEIASRTAAKRRKNKA